MSGIFTFVMVNFLKLLPPTPPPPGCFSSVKEIHAHIYPCKVGVKLHSDLNFMRSASHFGRGIVMPNLKPTTVAALAYRESIFKALPGGSDFTPLMTLYLTDTTSPEEIKLASS